MVAAWTGNTPSISIYPEYKALYQCTKQVSKIVGKSNLNVDDANANKISMNGAFA
jgi:hypothetical protein